MIGLRAAGTALVASMLTLGGLLYDSAAARIYWANSGGTTIGRANNDGSAAQESFVTAAGSPVGVAIDGTYLYWCQIASGTGAIGRASLGGSGTPDQNFITVGDSPRGVAVDAGSAYWTHAASGLGSIGRANLDGTGTPSQAFIPTGASPCGVAVEPDHLYWANGGDPGSVGQAHGPFAINQSFAPDAKDPCGVAFAAGWVYWANRAGNTVGRANLKGTVIDQGFIDTGSGNSPCGVAADDTYVYWTSPANGTIWRRPLDRSGTNEPIVTGAASPCGMAVDATAAVTPTTHDFAQTTVGATSDIQALFLANTSSSTMRVASATLVGPSPDDFVKTGDGCSLSRIAPGGGCVINVRFAPTDAGDRSAVLRIASSTEDSPNDVELRGEGVAPTADVVVPVTSQGGSQTSAPSSGAGTPSTAPAPVTPPDLVAAPLLPKAGLAGLRSSVVVDRSGVVALARAKNPPTAATRQTLVGRVNAARARRVVLGRGRTTVPEGRRATVVARLDARARHELRARRTLRVTATIVARGADGSTATVTRRLRLWAAGAKRY